MMDTISSYRPVAQILRDLRAINTIDAPQAALAHVRDVLIPIGEKLIALDRSGYVDTCGGWGRYARSGQLFNETGLAGKKSYILRYIKLAHFGFHAFEQAVKLANAAQMIFCHGTGLDWAIEVLRWLRRLRDGETAIVPPARPRKAERERLLLARVHHLEACLDRCDKELSKVADAGLWSDTVLNAVRLSRTEFDATGRFAANDDDDDPDHDDADVCDVCGQSAELATFDRDSYGTPWPYCEAFDYHLHFTLDGCAFEWNAKHANFIPPPHGLITVYPPRTRAFINPPYSMILEFLAKGYLETHSGDADLVACLIPNDCSTRYYEKYVLKASEVWTIGDRIRFDGASGSPKFSSLLVIFRRGYDGPPVYKHWRLTGQAGGTFITSTPVDAADWPEPSRLEG